MAQKPTYEELRQRVEELEKLVLEGEQAEKPLRGVNEEILKAKTMINELLAKHSGQSVKKIATETERDRYMTAEEACKYGLIDEVLKEEDEGKKKAKRQDSKESKK